MNHSEGPWHQRYGGGANYRKCIVIASGEDGDWGSVAWVPFENKGDINLIVAAPDLLEALKEISLEHHQDTCSSVLLPQCTGPEGQCDCHVAFAKKAIEEVEGK